MMFRNLQKIKYGINKIMTIKQKMISGLIWSFLESIFGQGLSFIVGIILARILSPKEYGLIGMLSVFIVISQSFINSRFSQALIQKQNCTVQDYSRFFDPLNAIVLICIQIYKIGNSPTKNDPFI